MKLSLYRAANHSSNDVVDDTDPDLMVTDQLDRVSSNFSLSIGYEKRKGAGKLQLFYVGELSLHTEKEKFVYTYGNSFSEDNHSPRRTIDFYEGSSLSFSRWPTDNIESDGIGIGLRAFAGLEYFFFPKISIGGEFGLGCTRYFGSRIIIAEEYWDLAANQVDTNIAEIITNNSLTFSDISNGRIILLFLF